MRTFVFTAWAAYVCASIAGAQPVARKEPVHYAGPERASRLQARPPGIRLAFATRLTALRLNGMDYSPYIAAWFGTDRLGANAAMEAPLRAAGRRPEISTSNSKA